MPKCHNFEWDDYAVRISPIGWRNVIRFLPYLSGSDVDFKISMRTKSKAERDFIYTRAVRRFDGHGMASDVCPTYDYRNKPTRILEDRFHDYLVTTGEYSIEVIMEEGTKCSRWQVVANFSVLERDKYVPYIIFSLISLFIGAGLTLLIQWLLAN
jgi:hypothetical protein